MDKLPLFPDLDRQPLPPKPRLPVIYTKRKPVPFLVVGGLVMGQMLWNGEVQLPLPKPSGEKNPYEREWNMEWPLDDDDLTDEEYERQIRTGRCARCGRPVRECDCD